MDENKIKQREEADVKPKLESILLMHKFWFFFSWTVLWHVSDCLESFCATIESFKGSASPYWRNWPISFQV